MGEGVTVRVLPAEMQPEGYSLGIAQVFWFTLLCLITGNQFIGGYIPQPLLRPAQGLRRRKGSILRTVGVPFQVVKIETPYEQRR